MTGQVLIAFFIILMVTILVLQHKRHKAALAAGRNPDDEVRQGGVCMAFCPSGSQSEKK